MIFAKYTVNFESSRNGFDAGSAHFFGFAGGLRKNDSRNSRAEESANALQLAPQAVPRDHGTSVPAKPSATLFLTDISTSSGFHASTLVALNRRTAVCGPACTVVWQGETREGLPYADF